MELYSSFCTFEIATFANVLGHYLRKYGMLSPSQPGGADYAHPLAFLA